MLSLSEKESIICQKNYLEVQKKLKKLLLNFEAYNCIEVLCYFTYLLQKGYLGINDEVKIDMDYQFAQTNNLRLSYQVLTNIFLCRHANSFFNDLLQSMDIPATLIRGYLWEENESYKPFTNHLLVMGYYEAVYLLDPFNDLIFISTSPEIFLGSDPSIHFSLLDDDCAYEKKHTWFQKYSLPLNYLEYLERFKKKKIELNNVIMTSSFQKEIENFKEQTREYKEPIVEIIQKYEMYRKLHINHIYHY